MRTTDLDTTTKALTDSRVNGEVSLRTDTFATFGFRRFSEECAEKLTALKTRVAAELGKEFASLNSRLIQQVLNEADSLAATTPYPALLLPVLAEEKARAASAWAARQRAIHNQTLAFAA